MKVRSRVRPPDDEITARNHRHEKIGDPQMSLRRKFFVIYFHGIIRNIQEMIFLKGIRLK